MKTWSAPKVEMIDVKLTASSGGPGAAEKNGGFVNGSFQYAEFDSSVYEKSDNTSTYCVIPIKSGDES